MSFPSGLVQGYEAVALTQDGVCQRKADKAAFSVRVTLSWAESAHRPHKLAVILGVLKCWELMEWLWGLRCPSSCRVFWMNGTSLGRPRPMCWLTQSRLIRKALPHLQRMCKTPSGFQVKPRDSCSKFCSVCARVDFQPHKNFGDSGIRSYLLGCEFIVHQTVKRFFKKKVLYVLSQKSPKPEQSLFLILICLFLKYKGV